jgi:hypothetical protein
MVDNMLTFPGLPWVSDALAVAILISFQVTFFVLLLAVLKFYVPGATRVSRIVGSLVGILAGVFFASGYTQTFVHYFAITDAMTSAVFFLFILMNVAITSTVYATHQPGDPNAASPSP